LLFTIWQDVGVLEGAIPLSRLHYSHLTVIYSFCAVEKNA